MRTITLAIICLLMALASAAQVPTGGNAANQRQPALCAVSGQVVTAAEGAPLKSSRIALFQQGTSSRSSVFVATTDNDGRFQIKKIAPGRYSFFATHAGYLTQQYQARGLSQGAILTLTPGQEVNQALFRLVRAAVVTGRIVDESGEPMAGLVVMAMRKLSAEEKEEFSPQGKKVQVVGSSATVTDDRGEYRIFGLKPGEYYVKAGESDAFPFSTNLQDDNISETVRNSLGSQFAAVFYPGAIQLDQAQSSSLAPAKKLRPISRCGTSRLSRSLGVSLLRTASPRPTHTSSLPFPRLSVELTNSLPVPEPRGNSALKVFRREAMS